MSTHEFLADFVPMAFVGLVVANVAYAAGALPFLAFIAGVGAAVAVYVVRERRASTRVGR